MTSKELTARIADLKRKREAATAGVWSLRWLARDGSFDERPEGWRNEILIEGESPQYIISVDGYCSDENTAFIACAANTAVGIVEELQEQLRLECEDHHAYFRKAGGVMNSEGGSAFPRPASMAADGHCDNRMAQDGMSLRDYFAGQALCRLANFDASDVSLVAQTAYQYADAMLEARKAERP